MQAVQTSEHPVRFSTERREVLIFLKGMKFGLATYDMEAFYYLARVSMVKDERNIDKFDRAFAATFDGIEQSGGSEL